MINEPRIDIKLKSKDGQTIGYSAFHMKVHQDVFPFLTEALNTVDLSNNTERFVKVTVDMGRVIGVSSCVKVSNSDTFRYAKRLGRDYCTRFVLNREPIPCDKVSIVLKLTPNGKRNYHLLTAFIGEMAHKEVADPKLTLEEAHDANEFWNNHALIWDESIIQPEEVK